jgi:hypothetical protein
VRDIRPGRPFCGCVDVPRLARPSLTGTGHRPAFGDDRSRVRLERRRHGLGVLGDSLPGVGAVSALGCGLLPAGVDGGQDSGELRVSVVRLSIALDKS